MFVFVFVRGSASAEKKRVGKMKIKRLLKFYYSAERLNSALDNLMLKLALSSAQSDKSCEFYAEKIIAVGEVKRELAELWGRLDGYMRGLTERDKATLKTYAFARVGAKKTGGIPEKEIHRAAVKFSRRAAGLLNSCQRAYKTLCAYYCLCDYS